MFLTFEKHLYSATNTVEPAYIEPTYNELLCILNSCNILLNIFLIYQIFHISNCLYIELFCDPFQV